MLRLDLYGPIRKEPCDKYYIVIQLVEMLGCHWFKSHHVV